MCLAAAPRLEAQGSPAIRVLDPALARAFHDALAVSTTLQGLVDEIEQSNLIVHVVGSFPHERRHHLGKMQFVNATRSHRYLRIWVDVRLTDDRRAEVIGHELFHAVEVARADSVVDRPSFAAHYRQIGEPSLLGLALDCFETADAQRAGRQVQREVRRSRTESDVRQVVIPWPRR